MTELVKFVHIATIAVWAGGLLVLPFLFAQRASVGREHDLHRMHAMVRFFYVVILSPSAFIAVGSGTALIFLQQTFEGWFTVKLFFVGLLVITHVLAGLVILRIFGEAETYPRWRFVTFTATTSTVVVAILVVVLAKPDIALDQVGGEWLAPGALGAAVEPIISRWTR